MKRRDVGLVPIKDDAVREQQAFIDVASRAPHVVGAGRSRCRAAFDHSMRHDDDDCFSRVATNSSTVHVGQQVSSFQRHAWREDGAESGGSEEGAEEAAGRLCLWCDMCEGVSWRWRLRGRYRCAAELLEYRAEVERCRGREGMHLQRGGEGGERATDSASRSRRGC